MTIADHAEAGPAGAQDRTAAESLAAALAQGWAQRRIGPIMLGAALALGLCVCALASVHVRTPEASAERGPPVRASGALVAAAEALQRPAQLGAAPMAEGALLGAEPENRGAYLVYPFLTPAPMTVREEVRLRSEPGEDAGRALNMVRPGQRLRIIGHVAWTQAEASAPQRREGDLWLQVRTDDGGEAYLLAESAIEVTAWRRARQAERQRAEQALIATAEDASAIVGAPLGEFAAPDAPPPPLAETPSDLY